MKLYDKIKTIPATYLRNTKNVCEEFIKLDLVNESSTIHELLLLIDYYNIEMIRNYEETKQDNEYFKKGVVVE